MPIEFMLLGAHHEDGPLYWIFVGIVSVIALFVRLTANFDVATKGGVPYCPRCNRRVSMKRGDCRSCGYRYVSWGMTPAEKAAKTERGVSDGELTREGMREVHERNAAEAAAKLAEEAARKNARDEAYRAKGVEPGPFAWFVTWFKSLPDLYQAIVIGVLMAIPAATIVAIVLMFMRS